jgi:hypothetical protein
MKRILLIMLLVPFLGACSMTGKDLIRSANLIKNTSQLTKSGVSESIITKTKDVLDPARGGGKW